MRRDSKVLLGIIGCALLTSAPGQARAPEVRADDVDLFFKVYDRARGAPDAEMLQRDYLDQGSAGLARFAELRRISGKAIAEAIARDPAVYAEARRCAAAMPAVVRRVGDAADRLLSLHPGGSMPAVTIAIGRGRPVAVGEARGAYIGLEALCAWKAPGANVEDRAYRVITHELVHTRQTGLADRTQHPTVLQAALVEGTAEFMTELLTGSVAYRHLADAMKGRERALEEAFLRDADRPAIGSEWVFNSGAASDRPGDLGYRIGYRIAKTYYRNAADKEKAVAAMLAIEDAHQFLAASGWTPGISLP